MMWIVATWVIVAAAWAAAVLYSRHLDRKLGRRDRELRYELQRKLMLEESTRLVKAQLVELREQEGESDVH